MQSKPPSRATPQPTSRAAAKSATRDRVIRTASRAIRRDGIAATGVAAIMAEAGLTHGGFYAHFASKDALVVAAIDAAFAESRRRIDTQLVGLAPAAALAGWIDLYVSQRHRDDRSRGCALTALSGEAAHAAPSGEAAHAAANATAALARGIASLTATLDGWLAACGVRDVTTSGSALLAEAVGAVVLARVLGRSNESDALLAAARGALRRRAGIDA